MGCDGGTIAKRKEIVKSKPRNQDRDRNADLSAKWQSCYLSGLSLKKPIVACQLGHLYNKIAIIEYLLELKQPATSSNQASTSSSKQQLTKNAIPHIRSLKDVKELKLKEKPDFDKAHQASSGNEQFKAQFVCPISGLDVNGKYKFYYLLTCGCVFSERALREVPNEKQCILCSKPYEPELDLILLNGSEKELKELEEKLKLKRKQQKSSKKMSLAIEGSGSQRMGDKLPVSAKQSQSKCHEELDNDLKPSKRHKAEFVR